MSAQVLPPPAATSAHFSLPLPAWNCLLACWNGNGVITKSEARQPCWQGTAVCSKTQFKGV